MLQVGESYADICFRIDPPEVAKVTPENVIPEKALIPDTFQDFTLEEKTVISHNVAM